jgi:CheY-like chemotaxis protein
MVEMKLFVTGSSPTSLKAVENITHVANNVLTRGYRLEVIDVLRHPNAAGAAGVFATPMLIKTKPAPEAWILGELNDPVRLMRVLAPADAPEHAAAVPVPGSRRIVVIDDFEGIHESFQVALHDMQVDLICARTGELGVEAVRAGNPNLIFLDLKMPGKDGVSTLRDIRKQNDTAPVIIMTAFADEFTTPLRRADSDGLQFELLAKPLDVDQLYLVSAVATGGFGPCLSDAQPVRTAAAG